MRREKCTQKAGPCSLLNMMLSSPKLKMSWFGVILLTYRYYNSARCFLLFVAVSACVVPRVLISIAIEIAVYTAYGMSRVSHAYWGYCLISLRAGILLCVKSCRLWPGLLRKPLDLYAVKYIFIVFHFVCGIFCVLLSWDWPCISHLARDKKSRIKDTQG